MEEGMLKCSSCGKEFPADSAKCKTCKGPMVCENGTCSCEPCGHAQPMDDMWCEDCLKKNS